MSPQCVAHPQVAAQYQCDTCERLLCGECVEEGHRLLFCAHCGERAMPLAAAAAATTPEVHRTRKLEAPYSFRDALFYPFRGLGAYLTFGYVILLVVFQVLGVVPGFGCAVTMLQALVALILPGFLFKIVRSSAAGETELPDWPDWTETGERIGEVFAAFVVGLLALFPLWLALDLTGCGLLELVTGEWGPLCLVAMAAGMAVGVIFWVPAFGAVGTFGSGWLGPRVDLHLRAIRVAGADFWQILALVVALYVSGQILKVAFLFLPLLGTILQAVIGVYTTFVAMHLIGLLFRKHSNAMQAIYS